MRQPTILWCHPRSCSTAFERTFLNRPDYECFHEPYTDAYYFGPERVHPRYRDASKCPQVERSTVTYAMATQRILYGRQKTDKKLFVKDMPYLLGTCKEEFERRVGRENLQKMQHTFLIRDPAKAIKSLYRITQGNNAEKGDDEGFLFEDFDPNEVGIKELATFMRYVKEDLGQPIVVVDADALIKDAEGQLRLYCKGIGEQFDERMVSWEAKKVDHFQTWNGWHHTAEQSTGFSSNIQHKDTPERTYPDIVYQTIDDCQVAYRYMRSFLP
ncbi:hypothetical protein BZG36_03668 [Bifiguratus adelaidae]|uniref:Sulfotransferase domain-containing protein n=1 Tax=Bifiguratus adelaidae TaxID=1938954 RepID=A0A261XZU4_9FUNG|nr:hypothetical protein BZG36_03668 [Bifiguratus adelaidae]